MTDFDTLARESLDRAVATADGDEHRDRSHPGRSLRSGVDVVDIDRIVRALDEFGESFKSRVYTGEERAYCDRRPDPPQHYAARWAAKEAFRKVVGADAPSVPFDAVGVARTEDGPTLSLAAPAEAALAHAFGGTDASADRVTTSVSLAHDRSAGVAVAHVVACVGSPAYGAAPPDGGDDG